MPGEMRALDRTAILEGVQGGVCAQCFRKCLCRRIANIIVMKAGLFRESTAEYAYYSVCRVVFVRSASATAVAPASPI